MSSEDKMNEISKHSSGCCNGYYSTTAATSLNTLCEHKSSQFLQYTNLIDPSPESLLSKDSFNMYIKNQANLSDTENDLLVSVIQKEYEDIRKKTGDKDVLGDSIYKHIFEYHSDSNSCQNSLILGEDTLSKESDKIQLNTQSPQKFPENTNHISKSQEITSYIHQSVINSDIDENCHYWENFPNYLGESNYMTYPSFYNYMNYLSYPFNQPKLINNKKSNLAEYQKTTKSNTTLAYNYSIHSQVQTTKTCIYPLSYNSGNALNVPFKEGIMIQTSHHVSVSSKFLQQKLDNRESITKIDYTNHIKGKILSLISLKDSSKKLQKSINLFTEEVIDLVFHEIFQMIIPNLHLSFCNYFFQKFFKVLSKDQRIQVLKLFKVNNMFSLCCLKIGVYLMVSIIERVNSSEEMQLIDSILSDKLLNLLVHPTGYRVLEKIVLKFDEKYFSQILPTIFSDFVAYCQNSFASEVIKIILSRIHKSSKASKAFATSITENLIELSSNHTSSSVVVASIYVSLLIKI